MSDLTLAKLDAVMRDFYEKYPPPPSNPLLSPFFRPLGMDVIIEPEIPRIQLSREAAELVGPKFAANVNAWLLARFGFREPLAKQPFILNGSMLIVSRRDYGILNAALS